MAKQKFDGQYIVGWDTCGNGIDFRSPQPYVCYGEDELKDEILLTIEKFHDQELEDDDEYKSEEIENICIFKLIEPTKKIILNTKTEIKKYKEVKIG
jgi:hypothetical protein